PGHRVLHVLDHGASQRAFLRKRFRHGQYRGGGNAQVEEVLAPAFRVAAGEDRAQDLGEFLDVGEPAVAVGEAWVVGQLRLADGFAERPPVARAGRGDGDVAAVGAAESLARRDVGAARAVRAGRDAGDEVVLRLPGQQAELGVQQRDLHFFAL